MKMNLTNKMFLLLIMMTTMLTISSNNLMLMWTSLEMNMIVMLPMLTKTKKMKDQVMKYFILQSLASSILMMSIFVNSIMETKIQESTLLMVSMMMKMGLMPFHTWMPMIMQYLSWNMCIMIMTIQKIPSMIIMAQLTLTKMLILPMTASLIFAPISAMNQLSTKKIMAYSSIANSPWLIMASKISKTYLMAFFVVYSTMNILLMKNLKLNNMMFINQMNTMEMKEKLKMMFLNFTMSGMPPTVGFMIKWMILKNMMMFSITLSIMMILSSMLSTMIYLKMMKTIMIMKSTTKKNMKQKKKSIKNELIFSILSTPMIMMIQ